jgi:hypothetical protein
LLGSHIIGPFDPILPPRTPVEKGLSSLVLEQKQAAFARDGKVEVNIAIEVGHRNLHPAAGAAAASSQTIP